MRVATAFSRQTTRYCDRPMHSKTSCACLSPTHCKEIKESVRGTSNEQEEVASRKMRRRSKVWRGVQDVHSLMYPSSWQIPRVLLVVQAPLWAVGIGYELVKSLSLQSFLLIVNELGWKGQAGEIRSEELKQGGARTSKG